jgi:hypothetical protein
VLPCIFDNFVWFTDVDLDRALRQHVTFYDGESPVRGNSVGEIRSALQDLLRANGISGEVGELPYGTSGKVGALLFHVDGIPQPIKNIAFSGEAAISDISNNADPVKSFFHSFKPFLNSFKFF